MKKIATLLVVASSFVWAQSYTYTENVRVIKSEPIYRTVTKKVPVEECWDEYVPVEPQGGDGTLGAVIGGVAGGILGSQVGKGSGKTAATVGGALVGTMVGKELGERSAPPPGYQTQRRCRTSYQETEEQISEYRNIAKYHGYEIIKFSSYPLKEIPVTITISY